MEKVCANCNKLLPIDNFPFVMKQGDASCFITPSDAKKRKAKCKPCLALQAKEYRLSKPTLWQEYAKARKEGKLKKDRYPKEDALLISAIRNRMRNAKYRVRRSPDLIVDMDEQFMYDLYKKQKGRCALSGILLSIQPKLPLSLSIDQIRPGEGYTHNNVQWVCTAVNRAKSDLSTIDFISLCKAVVRTCNDYPEKE